MAQSLKTLIGKESSSSSGGGPTDNREFKNFQDFYGVVERNSNYMPSNTRDCGNTSGGTGTGAQERKVDYNVTKNWVVPNGVSKIRVTILGAGGGGASRRNTHYNGGGGGQGAAFVSGEVNVTAGQTLDIQVGRGGQGADSTQSGGNGSSTTVAMSSGDGGTSVLSMISPGGYGGRESGNVPPTPGVGTLSGSALLAPNQINNKGGQSGSGSNRSFGFGPEGYGAGGGGSAGSYKNDGYRGGNASNSAGYSFTSGGGGGIGGRGGDAGSNNSTGQQWSHAGGGGGSRSAGIDGSNNDSSPQSHGGGGWTDQLTGYAYTPHEEQQQELSGAPARPDNYYRGYDPTNSNLNNDWSTWGWWKIMKGTRFGDGVSETVQASRLSGGGGSSGTYEGGLSGAGGGAAGGTSAGPATYGPKMFNGILGRLVGSGGAGTSSENHNFGHKCYMGGEGGAGGGGGGAASTTTQNQTTNRDWYNFFEWDPTNMAFTFSVNGNTFGAQYDGRGSQNLGDNMFRLQGTGGCGGACGGGGGSGTYSVAGCGGIGAGGGGGNGHFNTSYGGRGGEGGPGYVLIEW